MGAGTSTIVRERLKQHATLAPAESEAEMIWETPEITDLGSIADHTFVNTAGKTKPGPSDHTDNHGEPSLPPIGS